MENNSYQDEGFEAGVRAVTSRYNIREDYCDVCKAEANFVKVVDCEDYWRCMGCLSIMERKFVSRVEKTLKEIHNKRPVLSVENESDEPDNWEINRAKAKIMAEKEARKELEKEGKI